MDLYPIAPEDCLVLSALGRSSSLREAARLLQCDPAGLQRKVQRIAGDTGTLRKSGGRWQLTAKGQALVAWADESVRSQRRLLSEKQTLRLVSTMWMAEELLIPALPRLRKAFPESAFSFTVPRDSFERELAEGEADFAVVCHPPEDPAIAHRQVAPEEWVVVAPAAWGPLPFAELEKRPHVRHGSLNPDLLFGRESPASWLVCDSLIAVRAAVLAGHGWAYVPRILVARLLGEKKLAEIRHREQVLDRKVCVWWLRARADSRRNAPAVCEWVGRAKG